MRVEPQTEPPAQRSKEATLAHRGRTRFMVQSLWA
jgi:hypothetical protein